MESSGKVDLIKSNCVGKHHGDTELFDHKEWIEDFIHKAHLSEIHTIKSDFCCKIRCIYKTPEGEQYDSDFCGGDDTGYDPCKATLFSR